jgi:PAS domain S-box-containing protein
MRDFIKRALKIVNRLTQKQMEDLLLSAATEIDRLETVLDSVPEGLLVCDEKHHLVMANKAADRFLPIMRNETGSDTLWSVVRDETAADFFEATLLSGDKVIDKEIDVDIMGINRIFAVSVLPLVRDFQVTGSLIHIRDVTEKRTRESRLRRAENLASLTTLAAAVAHEIKNPLGSISIHIQLMQKAIARNKELFNAAQQNKERDNERPVPAFDLLDKYIAVVNEEVDRLNHIVVDFLFAVRPVNVELREGNINALIKDLTDFVFFELEEAHIECVLDLDNKLPLVAMDERFMKQALLNLIKNAQAAMAEGGSLIIKTERGDGEVLIRVTDTGTGISSDNISKIFEPYFTTKATGSGLGLTMVFKIVKEHQGEIFVKSKEGEGTSFTISLPIPQKERRLLPAGTGTGLAGAAP